MPPLVWDKPGDRVYETGLDRGVLYLPDGSAVPWNGLTSIIEHFNKETSSVYYDGRKINDLIVLGDFSASMRAITYPPEFIELEGLASIKPGVFYADQMPKTFGLCYRTQVGNDLEGEVDGYKIHILYNVLAIPSDKTYASITSDPNLVEFEWNISAIPEEISGLRPTSHVVIDSRDTDPWLMEELEAILYGSSNAFAALIPMQELTSYILNWYRVKIIDNGDGTWTAVAERDGFIEVLDEAQGVFEITNVNAVYLDDDTYLLSDTVHISEVPEIKVQDLNNGRWVASTDYDGLIVVTGNTFVINNATVVYVNDHTYVLSDTTAEN